MVHIYFTYIYKLFWERIYKIVGIISLVYLFSCSPEKKNADWLVHLHGQGTASSPRMADLNQDKLFDIVLGTGGTENVPSDTAVIALDGSVGTLLWHVPGRNQIVGSAIFKDITRDQVPDVFIGGRTGELMAINGANGNVTLHFFSFDSKKLPLI